MKAKIGMIAIALALTLAFTMTTMADLAGINKRSPFANRRAQTEEQVENGLPKQENPDVVIGGKARIGSNVDESIINVDGSINPKVLVNAPASVQLKTIEEAAEAEKERLKNERAEWEATQDTAVTDSEREKVYNDAERYLEKSLDTSLSRADREFYAQRYTKTKSQLQNAGEVAKTNNGIQTDTGEESGRMGILGWIFWIGGPIVLLAGIVTSIILYRRRNKNEDEEEDAEDAPPEGAQVHVA